MLCKQLNGWRNLSLTFSSLTNTPVNYSNTYTHTHYIYIYVCVCVCIYICVCVYIYIYIYIYIVEEGHGLLLLRVSRVMRSSDNLSDDRITRETLSNNNPCPSSPSSTILCSAYMALNTLQQDWLL